MASLQFTCISSSIATGISVTSDVSIPLPMPFVAICGVNNCICLLPHESGIFYSLSLPLATKGPVNCEAAFLFISNGWKKKNNRPLLWVRLVSQFTWWSVHTFFLFFTRVSIARSLCARKREREKERKREGGRERKRSKKRDRSWLKQDTWKRKEWLDGSYGKVHVHVLSYTLDAGRE